MPNSLHSSAIGSPASRRATNCILSSITEHSFQGIASSPRGGSVTHVSGTMCYLCLRPLTIEDAVIPKTGSMTRQGLIGRLKLFSQLFEVAILLFRHRQSAESETRSPPLNQNE